MYIKLFKSKNIHAVSMFASDSHGKPSCLLSESFHCMLLLELEQRKLKYDCIYVGSNIQYQVQETIVRGLISIQESLKDFYNEHY